MKKSIFYLTLLCSHLCYAQNTFQKIYGIGYGYSVQQTTDSGYVVFGSNYSSTPPGNVIDICILKTNQTGDTLWTRTLDYTPRDVASSGVQTMDGGFLITGTMEMPILTHCLIRLDAHGDWLWTKLINGSIGSSGESIIQTMDGGFIFTGRTTTPTSAVMLVKLDSAGTILWYKSYNHMGFDDAGHCVRQTSDQGYLIVGQSASSHSLISSVIVKTDSNGDTLWTKNISHYGFGGASSVIETFDGNYVVVGNTLININSSEYTYLFKLDTAGNLLWSKLYGNGDSTKSFNGISILQTSDSGIVMTGRYPSPQGQQDDIFLLKTNSVGDTLWTRYYYSVSYDQPFSIRQTNDNGYIISGTTQDSSHSGTYIYLIKTDSLGHTDCNEYIPSIVIDTFTVISQNLPVLGISVNATLQSIYPVIGQSVQAIDYCGVNSIASITNTVVKVFPNPTSNYVTIVFPPNGNHNSIDAISYFNLLGELVYTESIILRLGDSEVVSDISILPPGVYVARVEGNVNYQIMIIKQ